MFYDEKKSPYQYEYNSTPGLIQTNSPFDLQKELDRISHHVLFSQNAYILENFIAFYQHKEDIQNLIFSLFDKTSVLHISLGGSYLLKKYNKFSDVDMNIIIPGNYFSYKEIPSSAFSFFIRKELPCSKISLMILGEELFQKKTNLDFILTENYLHRDLAMREGLVWDFRNINLYGHLYTAPQQGLTPNLQVRIKRQLKFASLIFDGLFDTYHSEEKISLKMASRIGEAGILLHAVGIDIDAEKYSDLYTGTVCMDPLELSKEILTLEKYLSL